MSIVGSISSRTYLPYWGLMLVAGILEAVVALFLLGRPDITLIATVLAIGFATTLYGVLEIVAAFEIKNLPTRFDALTKPTDAVLGRERPGRFVALSRQAHGRRAATTARRPLDPAQSTEPARLITSSGTARSRAVDSSA